MSLATCRDLAETLTKFFFTILILRTGASAGLALINGLKRRHAGRTARALKNVAIFN